MSAQCPFELEGLVETALMPEHVYPVLEAAGNNAAKMLTLLSMAEEPDKEFTRSTLSKRVVAIQGADPAWVQNDSSPLSYCTNSFEPAGLVEHESTVSRRGNPQDAYRISAEGLRAGVPISGALLEWELRHPDHSLQTILGATNSPTDKERRMPSVRYDLYDVLLHSPDEKMSIAELRDAIGETSGRIQKVTDGMRDTGIAVVEEKFIPSARQLTIREPDTTYVTSQEHKIRPEILAVYKTAARIAVHGPVRINGQEFLDHIQPDSPDLSLHAIWRAMVAAKASSRMKFIDLDSFDEDNQQTQTMFSLTESYRQPIADLVESITGLIEQPQLVTASRERAGEIIRDPSVVSTLMAKAKRFSMNVGNWSPGQWRQFVIDNTPEAGIDARGLYEVATDTGRKISYQAFRTVLKELNGDGFDVTMEPQTSTIKSPLGYVTLKTAE
jgi:hypothetical protein